MSLLDDVSIVVTPNGYKAGTLFAVKPTDVLGSEEITNGDFSNELTDWTENGGSYATIVSGALNSNNPDAGNWYAENISQNVSFVNGTTYKLTFKAKNISGNLNLRITQGANPMASLDLTSTFVDYTYFYTANADNGSIRIFCNSAVGQFQIDDISVKEVTGADMDVTRATAATRVDENGLIEDVLSNVPRIDYTGGGCPHILAEPQRTNLVTYSEDFSQWLTSGSPTVTYNATTSPNGTTNATELLSTSGASRFQLSLGILSAGDYTQSVFVKYKDADVRMNFMNNAFGGSNTFNITSSGVTLNTSSNPTNIEDIGNGWYKISVTYTANGTNGSYLQIFGDLDTTYASYYLWGGSLEEGSYPTSYIPTSGSTVTRNQDIFTRDGIGSLINDSEGTLYFEGSTLENGGGIHRYISLSDGTNDNLIYIRVDSTSSRFRGFARGSSGSYTLITVNSIPQTDNNKIALVWDATNFRIWINGSERATTTINDVPVGMNTLNLADPISSGNFFGKVKQLQVYNTALTDTQLAALTS